MQFIDTDYYGISGALMKLLLRAYLFSALLFASLARQGFSQPIPLENATATASFVVGDGRYLPSQAIDGITNGDQGWALSAGGAPATWVCQTVTNIGFSSGTLITFTLYQGDGLPAYPNYQLGRFRLSATSQDRNTYADGLPNNGNVTADWSVLQPLSYFAANGATLTRQSDNSLLASGGTDPTIDTVYTVTAVTTLINITGFRLETLTDPSLPNNGPGRSSIGNFVLKEFQIAVSPAELLTNGDFESPTIASNSWSTATPEGWFWVGSLPGLLGNGVYSYGAIWGPPASGRQFLDLGDDSQSSIGQSFHADAADYELTWADNTANSAYAGTSPYQVCLIDSTSNVVFTTNYDAGHAGIWQYRSLPCSLPSGAYTLTFTAEGYYGGWDTVLDDISLHPAVTSLSPRITMQPRSTTNVVGAAVEFEVASAGAPPLYYQWRSNGNPLVDGGRVDGAWSNRLTISNIQISDSPGIYSVIISNNYGMVTSAVVTLDVTTNLTWTGAVSGEWTNPANWNPAHVPGATDHAIINSGLVNIPANAQFGTLDWTGGAITGSLTVASNAVLNLAGGNQYLPLDGALTNAGTVNWLSGVPQLDDSSGQYYYAGPIINLPGGVWNIQCDSYICGWHTYDGYPQNYNAYFSNQGVLRKIAGNGVTRFGLNGQNAVFLTNSGVIEADQGTISLEGGYSSTSDSSLLVALGGNRPGIDYGRISFFTPFHAQGSFSVVTENGFLPLPADGFGVLQYSSYTPAFSCLNLDLGNGVLLQPQFGKTSLNLVAESYSVNETIPPLFISRSGNNLLLQWPTGFPGWSLQTATNLTTTNWTQVGTQCGNQAVVPIDAPQQFFQLTKPFLAKLTEIRDGNQNLVLVAGATNGQSVVGNNLSTGQIWRWQNGVIQYYPSIPGGVNRLATAATGDCGTICGSANNSAWILTNGLFAALPTLGSSDWLAEASGISSDGNVIVGASQYSVSLAEVQPVTWATGGIVGLPFYYEGEALAVSADGSTVVGWSYSQNGTPASMWINGVQTILSWVTNAPVNGRALAASSAGLYAVGWEANTNGSPEAVMWTGSAVKELGYLTGGATSVAHGVSGDGQKVVGQSAVDGYQVHDQAFLWTPQTGMRSLAELLAQSGNSTNSWNFTTAQAISPDGRFIFGNAIHNGIPVGFIVDLDGGP